MVAVDRLMLLIVMLMIIVHPPWIELSWCGQPDLNSDLCVIMRQSPNCGIYAK